MRYAKAWLGIGAAIIVVSLVFGQVLGPAEHTTVLVEDGVTLGDNTDKDFTVTLDQATTDYTLGWDSGDNQWQWIASGNGVRIGTHSSGGNPTLGLYSADLSGASPLNHATLFMTTVDATTGDEFTSYGFQALGNGSLQTVANMAFSEETIATLDFAVGRIDINSSNPVLGGAFTAGIQSYTGTVGTGNGADVLFGDGEGYFVKMSSGTFFSPYTDDAKDLGTTSKRWRDLNLSGDANIGGSIILVSPDASCSQCTVDNSDVFSCTSVACP